MKPRRVNVDRMRRYARTRRPMLSTGERWERFIDACGLSAVRGPWPLHDLSASIRVPESMRDELQWLQGSAGITIDGVIGPQTWFALSDMARRRDIADVGERMMIGGQWATVKGEHIEWD